MGDKVSAEAGDGEGGRADGAGSEGALPEEPEGIVKIARKIGYPVIIKASGGGGGRGMRVVHTEAALLNAVTMTRTGGAGRRSATPLCTWRNSSRTRATSRSRYSPTSTRTRCYLGERDCSMQRRHQKVIEEAPAPDLTAKQRERIGERCADACRKIGYRGAGTFEFLYENGEFFFIEMNTRLQVEHPVTENDHRPGPGAAADPHRQRREAAVPAEGRRAARPCHRMPHQRRGSLPLHASPGKITSYHPPGGPGIRVDSHVYAGYTVPPNYDSMVGKVIAYGASREQAIRRMRIALSEMVIEGIQTNLPLHLDLLHDLRFLRGGTSIHYLEQKLAEETKNKK
jgi:acetyl-CoA carboxylase biotin carboxylase subunit